ncbi:MAG: DJ-1/PfpI family protein [Gemmatimonadaceae bacterium]|jgi:cyclohexyl-isocyanide hydratase|nr:DJ-1/PfpI family protein [Gemmatimonadaceae bacterium]
MDRRDFSRHLATAAALSAIPEWARAQPPVKQPPVAPAHSHGGMGAFIDALAAGDPAERAKILPATWRNIALVVYPGFFPLDLFGTKQVFDGLLNTNVHLVAKTREPVSAGRHVQLVPNHTFEDCPTGLDVLFLPGGGDGTVAAMKDPAMMAFLQRQAPSARYVTSVCTGALILGAAGLLKGYKATTHWVTHELLASLGATPVKSRVVQDRNRITGGGVTAGIDFGLTIAAALAGERYAKALQLNIEYAPAPPFQAGEPDGAGPVITEALRGTYTSIVANARAAAAGSVGAS